MWVSSLAIPLRTAQLLSFKGNSQRTRILLGFIHDSILFHQPIPATDDLTPRDVKEYRQLNHKRIQLLPEPQRQLHRTHHNRSFTRKHLIFECSYLQRRLWLSWGGGIQTTNLGSFNRWLPYEGEHQGESRLQVLMRYSPRFPNHVEIVCRNHLGGWFSTNFRKDLGVRIPLVLKRVESTYVYY